MKTLIRFLADIFGVTQSIREEQKKDTGMRLKDASYWMGGSALKHYQYKGELNSAKDALMLIGESLWQHGNFNIDGIREEMYKLHDKRAKQP